MLFLEKTPANLAISRSLFFWILLSEVEYMKKQLVFNIFKIVIGSFIFALSVNMFALSNKLGEGGVTGTTMVLFYLFGLAPALTNLILNGILMIIGYKFLDKSTIYYTILTIGLISLFLRLTHNTGMHLEHPLVASVAAGISMGVGIGLIMNSGSTTAGSAILAKIANKYLGWNTSYALLFFDLIVVIPSGFVIGFENMIFTVISLYISTKVLDLILEGANVKKSIMIISEKHEIIANMVEKKLDRGITVLHGHGHYTKQEKQILYVVVSRQQLREVTNFVREIDDKAFVIINDVKSVEGEGFTHKLTH